MPKANVDAGLERVDWRWIGVRPICRSGTFPAEVQPHFVDYTADMFCRLWRFAGYACDEIDDYCDNCITAINVRIRWICGFGGIVRMVTIRPAVFMVMLVSKQTKDSIGRVCISVFAWVFGGFKAQRFCRCGQTQPEGDDPGPGLSANAQ